jgi:hypothetical protein
LSSEWAKANISKGPAYDIPGGWFPIFAKVEAGLRVYISKGPPVQNNTGDIFFRPEAGIREKLSHLRHYRRFEFRIARPQKFFPPASPSPTALLV